MFAKVRFALLLPFAALLGCGSTAPISPASNYSFSGDWGIRATTNITTVPITQFLGVLSASGGVVSGSLTPLGNVGTACFAPSLTPITVSGTVDSSGNLTVTLPVAGGTATLTAAVSSNPDTLATGTYQIVGGTCAMSSNSMAISQYAPLNGTYTGTFNIPNSYGLPSPGTAITVTAVLAQSTAANANAQFPITGTVTTTGACATSFTLSSSSVVWGGGLIGIGASTILGGDFDPTGSTTQVAVFTNETASANCPYSSSQIFDGPLTRQ